MLCCCSTVRWTDQLHTSRTVFCFCIFAISCAEPAPFRWRYLWEATHRLELGKRLHDLLGPQQVLHRALGVPHQRELQAVHPRQPLLGRFSLRRVVHHLVHKKKRTRGGGYSMIFYIAYVIYVSSARNHVMACEHRIVAIWIRQPPTGRARVKRSVLWRSSTLQGGTGVHDMWTNPTPSSSSRGCASNRTDSEGASVGGCK